MTQEPGKGIMGRNMQRWGKDINLACLAYRGLGNCIMGGAGIVSELDKSQHRLNCTYNYLQLYISTSCRSMIEYLDGTTFCLLH